MSRQDPTDILAQQREQAKREEAARIAKAASIEDLRWVMSDARGRRYVWRQLQSTGLNEPSYTGNAETYFREGRRAIGLAEQGFIQAHCFEEYLVMLKENRVNE